MPKDTKIENIERLINNKNAQFRRFDIAFRTERDDENDIGKMIIDGKPIVFNSRTKLYSYGNTDVFETIDAHALDNTDLSDVILNYNHSGRVYARTRNNSLILEKRNDGLYFMATLWTDDEGHRQLYRDIERQNIDRMSFAFSYNPDKIDYSERVDDETGRRIVDTLIREIPRVFDVSAVDFPAYDETEISARSLFDAVSAKQAEVIELAARQSKALELFDKARRH